MRRRRVIAGLVVLAIVTVAAVALWPRGPRPCRATFEQVREGMTNDEVCATVGGPPGSYTDAFYYVEIDSDAERLPSMWCADDAVLAVDFGIDGRAVRIDLMEPDVFYRPSLFDRLRARLGL
jgi:outer membrane protein assembly factor BamE (lipoprotein component of BamABCDE complex)